MPTLIGVGLKLNGDACSGELYLPGDAEYIQLAAVDSRRADLVCDPHPHGSRSEEPHDIVGQ